MAGTMSLADLIGDHKAGLLDAAKPFVAANDADFNRHLVNGAQRLGRYFPRTNTGALTLVAGQPLYGGLPADFDRLKVDLYGITRLDPWESGYSGVLPAASVVNDSGVQKILLTPTPTTAHIGECGSTYSYLYFSQYTLAVDPAQTTVPAGLRQLLMMAAQIEAMLELAQSNVNKPVAVRDGLTGSPRNSTPAAMWQALAEDLDRECRK